MIYVTFAIKHFFPISLVHFGSRINIINVDIIVLHIRTYRHIHAFVPFSTIQFQMNYTSIVYCLLCVTLLQHHIHYFDFNGWVFRCVMCVCAYSFYLLLKTISISTRTSVWPMVKRSENLKFITNHLFVMCCIAFSLFVIRMRFKSNQINIFVRWTLYACAAASILYWIVQWRFDRWAIIRYPGLFANDHHFSMCIFVEFVWFSQINIISNFIKIDAIFFTTFVQNTLNENTNSQHAFIRLHILWGRKFPIKNLFQILKKKINLMKHLTFKHAWRSLTMVISPIRFDFYNEIFGCPYFW